VVGWFTLKVCWQQLEVEDGWLMYFFYKGSQGMGEKKSQVVISF